MLQFQILKMEKANPTIKTLEKLLDVLGMQINIEVVSK